MLSQLFVGDAIEVMDAMILDGIKVDAVITDPPYGTTKCKWDVVIPFDEMWRCIQALRKVNAPTILFGTEPFSSHLRLSNPKEYRYDWYWNKKRAANFLFMNRQPGKIVEIASVFYQRQPTYNPQKIPNPRGTQKKHLHANPAKITKNVRAIMGDGWKPTESDAQNYCGKNYEPDKLLPNNIIEVTKDTKRFHSTQKPVALMAYLIQTYTNPGDTVLDFTMGSGSTGVACAMLDRNFIGIEIDPEFVRISDDRINQALKDRHEETVC